MTQPSEHPRSEVAIVVLAAGESLRFGKSKQSYPVNGQPLLVISVQAALQSKAAKIIVLLGARSEQHAQLIRHLAVDILLNPDWKKGMGNSLKAGLGYAIESCPKLEAVLFMVCDQPLISSDHLNALIDEFESSRCNIASSYAGTIGVPVLFRSEAFPTLKKTDDQLGARKVLERLTYKIVNFPGGEIDIDTPDDLKKISG